MRLSKIKKLLAGCWKKTIAISLVIVLTFSFFQYKIAKAAALTTLSDTMSRVSDNTLSNHTIKFTTPTGAGDDTDTITIEFPSDFAIGSVDYTDIDLSHGASTGYETEETLAAAADATSWGAVFSSRTLTLTHPSNASNGDIAASDKIVVEIGTNASGGNAQLTNPTSTGTFVIIIDGTFGDDGQIAAAISGDDQVVVTTTIDPYLTFALSQTSVTLTKAGGGNPDYSNTGFNQGTANTLAASTNAQAGYTITYNGAALDDGAGHTITAMGTKAASSTDAEQFGINLKDNATPNTGTEPSGGSGAPASNYSTADQYHFAAGADTSLASASGSSATTTFTVSYITNVSQTTEAGVYSTTITYTCTGNF
jgi:hypothetical protein